MRGASAGDSIRSPSPIRIETTTVSTTATMIRPQVLLVRPSLLVGAAGPIVVGVWRAVAPRAEDVRAVVVPMLQHVKSRKQAAIMAVTHPTVPSPDTETRRAIVHEMRKLDPHLLCGATVVTRDGFAGTALRAVVSTLQLLAAPKHPEKVFATTAEAARFVHGVLAKHLADAPSAAEIAAACDELTRQAWSEQVSPPSLTQR